MRDVLLYAAVGVLTAVHRVVMTRPWLEPRKWIRRGHWIGVPIVMLIWPLVWLFWALLRTILRGSVRRWLRRQLKEAQ